MKKLMLTLIAILGMVHAESCLLPLEVESPAEETKYTIKSLCIDNNLYVGTLRSGEKDFIDVVPFVSYVGGNAVQRKCICPVIEILDESVHGVSPKKGK